MYVRVSECACEERVRAASYRAGRAALSRSAARAASERSRRCPPLKTRPRRRVGRTSAAEASMRARQEAPSHAPPLRLALALPGQGAGGARGKSEEEAAQCSEEAAQCAPQTQQMAGTGGRLHAACPPTRACRPASRPGVTCRRGYARRLWRRLPCSIPSPPPPTRRCVTSVCNTAKRRVSFSAQGLVFGAICGGGWREKGVRRRQGHPSGPGGSRTCLRTSSLSRPTRARPAPRPRCDASGGTRRA